MPVSLAHIERLVREKHTLTEIARETGVPKATMYRRLKILGVTPENGNGCPWSDEENHRLLTLRKAGNGFADIGRIMGRSRNSVAGQHWRLKKNGA